MYRRKNAKWNFRAIDRVVPVIVFHLDTFSRYFYLSSHNFVQGKQFISLETISAFDISRINFSRLSDSKTGILFVGYGPILSCETRFLHWQNKNKKKKVSGRINRDAVYRNGYVDAFKCAFLIGKENTSYSIPDKFNYTCSGTIGEPCRARSSRWNNKKKIYVYKVQVFRSPVYIKRHWKEHNTLYM